MTIVTSPAAGAKPAPKLSYADLMALAKSRMAARNLINDAIKTEAPAIEAAVREVVGEAKVEQITRANAIFDAAQETKNAKDTSTGIVLNEQQLQAVALSRKGASFCLTGAAGTGKTATTRAMMTALLATPELPRLSEQDVGESKVLIKNAPGIWCGAYTRRATRNIKAQLPSGINYSTIHALLEYVPEQYEEINPDSGQMVTKMRFAPRRNKQNPLPASLKYLYIDEASMLGLDLWQQLIEALPHKPTIVFIGDINQLPPVFGDAIFGYALTSLPVVTLTQVYRQRDGEILDFAWRILEGKQVLSSELTTPFFKNERLKVMQWRNSMSADIAVMSQGKAIQKMIETGDLDPIAGDLVLCPYNVGFGTVELNRWIADYYDKRDSRLIYEVIAGFNKHYFAVGDKILVDKEDAVITRIEINRVYRGKLPAEPSKNIDRWGASRVSDIDAIFGAGINPEDELVASNTLSIEERLALAMGAIDSGGTEEQERKMEASHQIYYRFLDSVVEEKAPISSAGAINAMELAYCLTVHKSQGSQARHVVLCISNHHKTMLSRELLYTAVTRAQERLTIWCDPSNIAKAINSPRIKGTNVAEKAMHFKGKLGMLGDKEITPLKDVISMGNDEEGGC